MYKLGVAGSRKLGRQPRADEPSSPGGFKVQAGQFPGVASCRVVSPSNSLRASSLWGYDPIRHESPCIRPHARTRDICGNLGSAVKSGRAW